MLFNMRSQNQSIHWTEIYLIVTVSAALIEDIRRVRTKIINNKSMFI